MKYPPECPYCGREVSRPDVTKTEFGEVLSGKCVCGTVYVCDPTGRNAGEAYMEALALAKGDWDLGAMGEDADYETADIDYDIRTHQCIYAKGQSVKSGKLVFVKMMKQAAEETQTVKQPASADESPRVEREPGGRKIKGTLKKLLESRSFKEIAEISRHDKSVIRWLISLAYDKENALSWRAMEALGSIVPEFTGDRMVIMRDTIRRLLWSMSDESGGIGWSAAEMLGEIIRNNPDEFQDIIPLVWSYREEGMFRPGAVWAMGRIAAVRPDLVKFISKDLHELLHDEDPSVRGYAVWVEGMLGDTDGLEEVKKLSDDNNTINFYSDGDLMKKTVREIAREALNTASNR